MPRVSQLLLEATIFLYKTKDAAKAGAAFGGSGVLVGVESESSNPPFTKLYFVTCDHVARLAAPVVRVVRSWSGEEEFETPRWKGHPDYDPDVAVAFFRTVSGIRGASPYSYIPYTRFATLDDFTPRPPALQSDSGQPYYLGELVGPGDDTVMVGRFLAEDGILSQTPTVRFGNLSSAGPVTVDFTDPPRPSRQECLLVESRSLPGYSGSAVYHFHPATTYDGLDLPVGATNHPIWRLLGIDCGHMKQKIGANGLPSPGWQPAMAIPGQPLEGSVNAGMMIVVPSWKIAQVLEELMTESEEETRV